MNGITRILIQDGVAGAGAWRFEKSRAMQSAANAIYHETFTKLGMPLASGSEQKSVSKSEHLAGFDYELGIDVLFRFSSGQTATLQEKFLFTKYSTVTVEYMQDWRRGTRGDWFTMKCQYYFVGYADNGKFCRWVLLDWPRIQLATAQERIYWREIRNGKDGARASFVYAEFSALPADVIVASNTIAK